MMTVTITLAVLFQAVFCSAIESWVPVSISGEIPSPRVGAAIAWMESGKQIFIFGGKSSTAPQLYNDIYIISFVNTTNFTSTKIPASSPPFMLNSSAVFNSDSNSIYVFGGFITDNPNADCYACNCCKISNEMWNYDLARNSWHNISSTLSPPARIGHTAFNTFLGRLIVYGGLDVNNSVLHDMWAFDFSSQMWTNITADGPTGIYARIAGPIRFSEEILVFGINPTIFLYSFSTDSWTELSYTIVGNKSVVYPVSSSAIFTPSSFVYYAFSSDCQGCLYLYDSLKNIFFVTQPSGNSGKPESTESFIFRIPDVGLWVFSLSEIYFLQDDEAYCGDKITQVWEDCDGVYMNCDNCTITEEKCVDITLNYGKECEPEGQLCSVQCKCPTHDFFPNGQGSCFPITAGDEFFLLIPCGILAAILILSFIVNLRNWVQFKPPTSRKTFERT